MALSKEMEAAAALDEVYPVEVFNVNRIAEVIQNAKDGRSALAVALLDDIASRKASYEKTRQHLLAQEAEDSRMSWGTWAVLWFLVGMLVTLAIEKTGTEFAYWLIHSSGLI